jgi:hypothetical protein
LQDLHTFQVSAWINGLLLGACRRELESISRVAHNLQLEFLGDLAMSFLIVLLFVSVFVTGHLVQRLELVPSYWALVPELLSMIALLIVLARLIGGRSVALDWRYGAFFALFFFVLLFGYLAQSVPAGPIVAGLRNYVKFIPFFLLPTVYPFTAHQLAVQLRCLVAILLVQTPLAVYQRFVEFADRMHTGDPVRGMTSSSSALTILMVCAIALLVSLYLRRRIGLRLLTVGIGVFLLPTTLNETKSTFLLLPLAMLVPPLFMAKGSRSLRKLVPIAAIGGVAVLSYVTIYDFLIQYRSTGHDIGSFFTEGYVEKYLYTGAAEGDGNGVGRVDSVVFATKVLSADPLALAFGLGAGNVSESKLPGFDGQYSTYLDRYGVQITQVSSFVWEIGLVGVFAYLLLFWFVFQDARLLGKSGEPAALRGQVWATVILIMTAALMYKSVFYMNEIAYPFWFYSGVVARDAYTTRFARRRDAAPAANRARPAPVEVTGRAASPPRPY